jgi:hydroxyethylthiazole kinase
MFDVYGMLEKVREKRPLIHHITNMVTIYECAAITRDFGALPVMAYAKEEVEQMVGAAGALVLNIGTLTPELVDTMLLAARAANRRGIPVILDAVGAGATSLRTDSTLTILDGVRVDVLKGNYGEMAAVAGQAGRVTGVESLGVTGEPKDIAKSLSEKYKNAVAMTGKTDIVSGHGQTYLVDNGAPIMGTIVGTGCMASSVIACFAAVEPDMAKAATAALAAFGIAGEVAANFAAGPGSYRAALYDAVHSLNRDYIDTYLRVTGP